MREFDLADILTCTTGIVVTERGIAAVYDITGYLCHDNNITTVGLLVLADKVREEILRQLPILRDVIAPDFSSGDGVAINAWVAEQKKLYSDSFYLLPMVSAPKRESDLEYFFKINPRARGLVVDTESDTL